MAAFCNAHPELVRAAVLRVAYLDVLTTMSDPSLPLTEHEVDEWGDPRREPGTVSSSGVPSLLCGLVGGAVPVRSALLPSG